MIVQERIVAEVTKYKNDAYPENIARRLKLKGAALDEFWVTLKKMERKGILKFNGKGMLKLQKNKEQAVQTGRLELKNGGFGFVVLESASGEKLPDVFVAANNLNGAMHGDKVHVRVFTVQAGKKIEGAVVEIEESAHKNLVGNLSKNGKVAFVTPDDKKIKVDIYVREKNLNGAQNGQKVLVEIVKRAVDGRKPEGRVVEILGDMDQSDIEIVSIIKQQGLSLKFPDSVLKEAQNVPQKVVAKEWDKRRDLRERCIVTIDGEDARDLDDAVYVQANERGYLLGVYIADVSNYVPLNGIIDLEARDRGTSVYLVDRVLPMLPVELSNGICSLNAQVERLALACEMQFDLMGERLSYEVFPAVIKVDTRLSYTVVKQMLTGEGNIADLSPYSHLQGDLERMRELCLVLNKKRNARGAIDFNFPEQKVKLDESGKPLAIIKRENGLAENIIEEFMLAANETVAEHLSKLGYLSVYRVHEPPVSTKIEALQKLLHNFNISAKFAKEVQPRDIQKVIADIKGRVEERMISFITLRSMQQAKYTTENSGHFGLAAEYYTHFTSPIRRYPDLMIHRLLYDSIKYGKKLSASKKEFYKNHLSNICEHASSMERKAAEAERMSVDYKIAEYMYEHIGKTFEGTISSVTAFGMFVELDNGAEGLVHISFLQDDNYTYDEDSYTLYGTRRNNQYRLGDRLKVEVLNVNVQERNIDLIPAEMSLESKLLLKAQSNRKRIAFDNGGLTRVGKNGVGFNRDNKPLSPQARLIKAAAHRENGGLKSSQKGKAKGRPTAETRGKNKSGAKPQQKRKATSKAGMFAQSKHKKK